MNMKKSFLISVFFIFLLSFSGVNAAIFDKDSNYCKPNLSKYTFPTTPGSGSSVNDYMQFILDIFAWLHETNLLFCAIIPVLGAFIISLGFLNTLRIFKDSWINVAISILIGISFTSFGPLNFIVGYIFQGMGAWGVGIFAAMFFVGTYLLFLRRKAEWGTQSSIASAFEKESKMLDNSIREKREEYEKLMHDLATANIIARAGIRSRMKKIEKEVRDLTGRLKELKEEYET